MLNWTEFYARQEYIEDLRRQAEKERLIQEALAGRQKSTRLYGAALVGLGRRLVGWGRPRLLRPLGNRL